MGRRYEHATRSEVVKGGVIGAILGGRRKVDKVAGVGVFSVEVGREGEGGGIETGIPSGLELNLSPDVSGVAQGPLMCHRNELCTFQEVDVLVEVVGLLR